MSDNSSRDLSQAVGGVVLRRHEVCAVSNNKHGYRGVEWDRARQMYRARIESTPGLRGRWLGRFPTAELAAQAYDGAAREVYGEAARLNFPLNGERPTIQSRRKDGFCPKGHDLAKTGYVRPDGSGMNCRACNAEASNRRHARLRAAADTTDGQVSPGRTNLIEKGERDG